MTLTLRDLLQVPIMLTSIDNEDYDMADVEACTKVSLASFSDIGLIVFKQILDARIVKIDYGAIVIDFENTNALLEFCSALNGSSPGMWDGKDLLTEDHWI